MHGTRALSGTFGWAALIVSGLAAMPAQAVAGFDDKDAQFQQMRDRARVALEERMKARIASGWTPKSKEEQMITRLERHRDRLIREQERVQTRAAFEAARAEVFLEMARRFTQIGYHRRRYASSYGSSRVAGSLGTVVRTREYVVVDPLAVRLAAYFGEKAARSKAIAAAREYHASTYYERRINNTGTRIAMLQRQVAMRAQLAAHAP